MFSLLHLELLPLLGPKLHLSRVLNNTKAHNLSFKLSAFKFVVPMSLLQQHNFNEALTAMA